MLTIKQAVTTAFLSFEDLFPSEAKDLRLEEIDHSQEDDFWKITVSVANADFEKDLATQKDLRNSVMAALGGGVTVPSRRFKSIIVDSNSGELVSIKNA